MQQERQTTCTNGEQRETHIALRQKASALALSLERWANTLEKPYFSVRRQSTSEETRHWKKRGSQETLRNVARYLKGMSRQYQSDYALYKALAEYLECLNTSIDDANEDACGASPYRKAEIERWKAVGEGHVLPRVCAKLARLLERHHPQHDHFPLSLDGKAVVHFPNDENEPMDVANHLLPAVSGSHDLFFTRQPTQCLFQ